MNTSPRSKLRGITTRAEKRRILRTLDDDVLIKFLIDAAQDANDPHIERYKDEDKDIVEIIKEMLIRMDSRKTLEAMQNESTGSRT